MTTNPLKSLIRQPRIYVKLPSNGRFNKDKIDFTANLELPVRATTAKDDLILRNPDALLNGDAVEQILKSCIPEIHNIRETPSNDIDVLLLAIQYATKGDKFEFKSICPKCGGESSYTNSIRMMLESISEIPEINSVSYNEGETEVTVILQPITFAANNKASLIELDSQKRIKYIKSIYESSLNTAYKDEKERIENIDNTEIQVRQQISEAYKSIANLAVSIMLDSVIQINLKNQDGTSVIVTDKDHISEYINSLTTDKQLLIKTKLDEVMTYGLVKKPKLICNASVTEEIVNPEGGETSTNQSICGYEYEKTEVGYDQSNFFVNSSLFRQARK